MDTGQWWEYAECRGQPVNTFYPRTSKEMRSVIREYCSSCPVRSECLEDVMMIEQLIGHRYGVSGGMTPGQRAHLEYRRTLKTA
jgi:transcription factor WhiB